jgi:type IV fimbrial biogenesis protein FimT
MNAAIRGGTPRKVAGFTIMELIITLVIAGILASFALPSFGYLSANTRVKSAATELYLSLIKARSEATKRNAAVTVSRTGSNWEGGWKVLDAGANTLLTQDTVKGINITSAAASVVYLSSGRIQGTTAPSFEVTAQKYTTIKRCISADLTGRPYIKASAC